MNKDRKRMVFMAGLMVFSCLATVAAALFFISRLHIGHVMDDLTATARSQARLIEAIARYDRKYDNDYPGSSRQATLDQIRNAHEQYQGFGETGEFVLAHREGDNIVFEFRHGRNGVDIPDSIPFASKNAEPMQRALSGLSGTMIGRDYRGERVVAAYEPVAVLDMGIVAKLDMAEFRAPFINAGLIALGITLVVVFASVTLFFKLGSPMVEKLEEYADSLEQEVAERKSAEELLQLIIDSVPALVSYVDKDYRYRFVNKGYGEWFGVSTEQIVGTPVSEVIGDEALKAVKPDLDRALSGEAVGYEREIKYSTGSRWTRSRFVPDVDDEGNARGLVAFVEDITERKQAEKVLRESHEGLDRKVRERTAVLDGINRVFQESLSCDSDEEVAAICLEVAQELTGSKFGFICEVNENKRFDTIAISDPGWSACRMPETETALKVDDMEVRGVRAIPLQTKETFISNGPASHPDWIGPPEGHPEITSFMCTPIMKGDRVFLLLGLGNSETGYGKFDKRAVESISAAFKEALAGKRSEKAVSDYAAKLEASNKELQAFSYSVSHDLRAPLRGIQGFSNMLMEDCAEQLDSEGQRYVEIIRSEVERMGQLIDDILSISRISRQEMRQARINMEEMVKEITEETERLHPDRSIDWKIGELCPASGDTVLVQQVLRNLIGNAVKFSEKEDPAIIEVGCESDSGRNVYFVKDNGVGFDEKYKDKLFGVFQRLHAEDEFEGTGVGLAVVKRIISRHGGKVWAEGRPGCGATFYFSLPKGE